MDFYVASGFDGWQINGTFCNLSKNFEEPSRGTIPALVLSCPGSLRDEAKAKMRIWQDSRMAGGWCTFPSLITYYYYV